NGEGVSDPATHLESYQIRLTRTTPRQPRTATHHVTVTNQFHVQEALRLDTLQPDRLLVPSAKCVDQPGHACPVPVPPPDPTKHEVDHFKCYKVRVSTTGPRFTPIKRVAVADQFSPTARLFDLTGPQRLCNPVDKEGEGIKNPNNHLL